MRDMHVVSSNDIVSPRAHYSSSEKKSTSLMLVDAFNQVSECNVVQPVLSGASNDIFGILVWKLPIGLSLKHCDSMLQVSDISPFFQKYCGGAKVVNIGDIICGMNKTPIFNYSPSEFNKLIHNTTTPFVLWIASAKSFECHDHQNANVVKTSRCLRLDSPEKQEQRKLIPNRLSPIENRKNWPMPISKKEDKHSTPANRREKSSREALSADVGLKRKHQICDNDMIIPWPFFNFHGLVKCSDFWCGIHDSFFTSSKVDIAEFIRKSILQQDKGAPFRAAESLLAVPSLGRKYRKLQIDSCNDTTSKHVEIDDEQPLSEGAIVSVAKRTWPGMNKLGGAGRIIGCSKVPGLAHAKYQYHVKYVLGGNEKGIDRKYIKLADGDDITSSEQENPLTFIQSAQQTKSETFFQVNAVIFSESCSGYAPLTATHIISPTHVRLSFDQLNENVVRIPTTTSNAYIDLIDFEAKNDSNLNMNDGDVVLVELLQTQKDLCFLLSKLRKKYSFLDSIVKKQVEAQSEKEASSFQNLASFDKSQSHSKISHPKKDKFRCVESACSTHCNIEAVEQKQTCRLCGRHGDNLMAMDDGGRRCWFAHELCAVYTPETYVVNEIVYGFNLIPIARKQLSCHICKGKKGYAKVQCAYGRCTLAFHVHCAFNEGLLYKSSSGFHIWCAKHKHCKPADAIEEMKVASECSTEDIKTTFQGLKNAFDSSLISFNTPLKASVGGAIDAVELGGASANFALVQHATENVSIPLTPSMRLCKLCNISDELVNFETSCGGFAHESCAMYTPETYVLSSNHSKSLVVHGIESIPKAREQLVCEICLKSSGLAKIQCAYGRCVRAFHVHCASNEGLLSKPEMGFFVWCKKHIDHHLNCKSDLGGILPGLKKINIVGLCNAVHESPKSLYESPLGSDPKACLQSDINVVGGHHFIGPQPIKVDIENENNGRSPPLKVCFDIGSLVFVSKRNWPGINKEGGVGRIKKMNKHVTNTGKVDHTYDVTYVLCGSTEKEIPECYVSLHSHDSARKRRNRRSL